VVPRLAAGATVKGPTLALLGEGGEDEFVIPRSKLAKQQGNARPEVHIHGLERTRTLEKARGLSCRGYFTGEGNR
jgi:hypothetical protein